MILDQIINISNCLSNQLEDLLVPYQLCILQRCHSFPIRDIRLLPTQMLQKLLNIYYLLVVYGEVEGQDVRDRIHPQQHFFVDFYLFIVKDFLEVGVIVFRLLLCFGSWYRVGEGLPSSFLEGGLALIV